MPLGICMTKRGDHGLGPGSHASTFGGNPVCIASALATIDIIEREGMPTPPGRARTSSPA
jgi:4-aminobutyrate aminotransferase